MAVGLRDFAGPLGLGRPRRVSRVACCCRNGRFNGCASALVRDAASALQLRAWLRHRLEGPAQPTCLPVQPAWENLSRALG